MSEDENESENDSIPIAVPDEASQQITEVTIRTKDGRMYEFSGREDSIEKIGPATWVYFENSRVE